MIVDLVAALAWPTALVWISYLFRREVRSLLSRVSRLKYKELEAKFDKKLLADAEAQVLEAKGRELPALPAPDTLPKLEQLRRIAEISPRAAITEAWALVEVAAAEAGLVKGKTLSRLYPQTVVEHLATSGQLSEDSIGLLSKLRTLRNQAAHLPDFSISHDEAERYLGLAVRCTEILNEAKSRKSS